MGLKQEQGGLNILLRPLFADMPQAYLKHDYLIMAVPNEQENDELTEAAM